MSRSLSLLIFVSLACGDAADEPVPDAADVSVDIGGDPAFVASCVYENSFSSSPECREYRGAGWSSSSASADCEAVFFGMAGSYAEGPCALDDEIGRCVVGELDGEGYTIVSTGEATSCGAAQAGCEAFAGGTFAADPVCNSCEPGDEEGQPFVPPYTDCRPPLEGEPPGASDGEVCTVTLISASTEEGRRFADYAECDVVRNQRPYYAERAEVTVVPDDPRVSDADYLTELAWVRGQAEASACACCHTASDTPDGAAIWDTEAEPFWIDTVSDAALAMLAGYTDSAAFGFLPTEENNGFDRSTTGLPTTDRDRLVAFFDTELTRRGLTETDAREQPLFAPMFRELIEFEPEACAEGVGMDEDGLIRWTGGGARYVSILEADARSPGLPPNWDLPEGTLWAIAASPDTSAMGCGMAYGAVPENVSQRVPENGAPPALVSGQQYYLYVQRDVALPIARCLFTAP